MKIDVALNHLIAGRVTPIGITYKVEPRHNKTRVEKRMKLGHAESFDKSGEVSAWEEIKVKNPFYIKESKSWAIYKIGELNGFAGGQYGSIVNNQRAREEVETNFEPLPLWNGKGIHLNNFLAKHVETGKVYLKVMPQAIQVENEFTVKAKCQYRWIHNNEPLSNTDLATLATFEPVKSVSSRQETEKPVFWMTIGVENIFSMRFGGNNYQITT